MPQNERIKELRKTLGLTLEKFGQSLGVSHAAISNIESGKRNLTEQMTKSICREYNVNENWLRNGEGDMFNELSQHDQAAAIVNNVLSSEDDFRKKVFIALGEMSESEWDLVQKFVDRVKSKEQ